MLINSSRVTCASLGSVGLRNPDRVPSSAALNPIGWVYIAKSCQLGHEAAELWQHISITQGQPPFRHGGNLMSGVAGAFPAPSQDTCLKHLGAELCAARGDEMHPAEK